MQGGAGSASTQAAHLSRAFGCDQCHDMVGVATATTAWPHGNSGALFYEWNSSAVRTTVDPGPGNLWMYSANVAGYATAAAQSGTNIPTPVNPSQTIIRGAVGTESTPGYINDGACMKCHIPTDDQSIKAMTGNPSATVDNITVVTSRFDSTNNNVTNWLNANSNRNGNLTLGVNNPLRGHNNQLGIDDLRLDLANTVLNIDAPNSNPNGETPVGSFLIWIYR
jgi:hypothetical protein